MINPSPQPRVLSNGERKEFEFNQMIDNMFQHRNEDDEPLDPPSSPDLLERAKSEESHIWLNPPSSPILDSDHLADIFHMAAPVRTDRPPLRRLPTIGLDGESW